jgi:hypothetical protein
MKEATLLTSPQIEPALLELETMIQKLLPTRWEEASKKIEVMKKYARNRQCRKMLEVFDEFDPWLRDAHVPGDIFHKLTEIGYLVMVITHTV